MMEFKAIAECYGKEYNKWKRCKECAARKWCRHAGDPAPVFNQGHIKDSQNSIYEEKLPGDELDLNAPEYSRQDMLEVIVLMMSLDLQTLEMLEQKINNPHISFAKMGRRKNITRQAVHKFITKKCLEVPELETIFRNRRKKAGINKLAA